MRPGGRRHDDDGVFEVRIHGRGGQGVVTAAELLSVAAVDTYLEHAVIVVPTPAGAHQRACGSRSVVLRASARAERLR